MTTPFIVADLGLSANQSAKLLVAFFPGYVITQIPEGMLAEIVGGKGRSFPSAEGQIVSFCRRKRSTIPKRLQLFGKGRSSARRAERFLL